MRKSYFGSPTNRLTPNSIGPAWYHPSGKGWQHDRLRRGQESFESSFFGANPKDSLSGGESPHAVPTPNGHISTLRMVEAILLIAREPISARKLALLAELEDATQARSLARQLNEIYDLRGHSFRIEEVAGGMQLLTRPQFANWLRRLEHVRGEEILSSGMLECLSIVAYRQPVMRAEIEAIRGVGCDEVLRQLMQRDLVRIAGRHEELGRPYLYGTTKRFLQLFGLQSLDSLPRAQKIRQAEAEIATRLRVGDNTHSDSIAEPPTSDGSVNG